MEILKGLEGALKSIDKIVTTHAKGTTGVQVILTIQTDNGEQQVEFGGLLFPEVVGHKVKYELREEGPYVYAECLHDLNTGREYINRMIAR